MTTPFAPFADDIPRLYDRHLGPVLFTEFARDLARRVAAAEPRRVLEIAAGTGIVTRAMRAALPAHTHLTATDLSEGMLAIARENVDDHASTDFRVADATALPFDEGTFSTVACQFGVMFFPDKVQAHREARRVLEPGGRYLFSTWDSFDHNPFARIVDDSVASAFPDDPPGFYQLPFSYHDHDEIAAAVHSAGFDDIEISVIRADAPIADFGGFARGIVFGNPMIEEIRARGGPSAEEIHDLIRRALATAFGSPARMPLQAIVLSAVAPGSD